MFVELPGGDAVLPAVVVGIVLSVKGGFPAVVVVVLAGGGSPDEDGGIEVTVVTVVVVVVPLAGGS